MKRTCSGEVIPLTGCESTARENVLFYYAEIIFKTGRRSGLRDSVTYIDVADAETQWQLSSGVQQYSYTSLSVLTHRIPWQSD
jgi:hypothetical protein